MLMTHSADGGGRPPAAALCTSVPAAGDIDCWSPPFVDANPPLTNGHPVAFVADLQGPHLHRRVALDDIGERTVRPNSPPRWESSLRYDRCAPIPGIDELPGQSALWGLLKTALSFQGAGCRCDLVIDQLQRAFVQPRRRRSGHGGNFTGPAGGRRIHRIEGFFSKVNMTVMGCTCVTHDDARSCRRRARCLPGSTRRIPVRPSMAT